jgi:hypothetical protein
MIGTGKISAIRSLYAAAGVCAAGGHYLGAALGDEGKAQFDFADPDGRIAELERAYFRRSLPAVQPANYVDCLMRLRDDMRRAQGER